MTKNNEELDKITDERALENAKQEAELMQSSLMNLYENMDLLKRKYETHKRMVEIQLEKLDVINPSYAYEQDEEYQELMRIHTEIGWKMKAKHEYDKYISQLDSAILTHEETLESLRKKIEEMENN